MTEQIKTLLWVIPITLVIWIYAEREQVVVPNGPNVSGVRVSIRPIDGLSIEVLGFAESTPTISLQLTGPQQALERVREQLTTRIPLGVNIELGNIGVGNSQPINLLDHLASQDVFKLNGVSVMKVQPENLYVNVERKIKKELPVLIPPDIDTLTPETHFTPATISVSGPESLVNSSDFRAFANLSSAQVPKKPGPYTLAAVPVKLSLSSDKLQIDPPQVRADLLVRNPDVPFDIRGMYIYVKSPVAMLTKYDITLPNGETIDETHVTGPADKIKLLEDHTFTPQAVLEILPDDVQTRKQLTYILPEGVTVTPEDQKRQFDYTLTRKQ